MYQKIVIIGRLGRDPEMRYTPQGTAVTSFSVATDRVWTDQSGQRQQRTTWFRVSAWGRLAETTNQYLSKGRLVMVEGEMQEPRPWQSQTGEWRANLEVRATNVQFLGGRGEGGAAGPQERSDDQDVMGAGSMLDEEEIPF
ncbi:MAG: single-stranded DNA-binding protein [Anaerolineae bacterium]|jgi:single-strand DNA-binding protein|nr:single-stranded DNA-binding protein [Chloroflexota bacterium]